MVVNKNIITGVTLVVVLILGYLFSFQLQKVTTKGMHLLSEKLGTFSNTKDLALQRYVYQHSGSLIAKIYKWINKQTIALGLNRNGVTPLGYFLFWVIASGLVSLFIFWYFHMGAVMSGMLWIILLVCMLVMTRVVVSERIEKSEMAVMDAIDLIVPELDKGVQNAIVMYHQSMPIEIREHFSVFISNIHDRGFTFEDAMYILADNLGDVFRDFAEKAIYYERAGEKDLLTIFTDIVETNRLRRQLREKNNRRFRDLRVTFVVSSLMTFAYFVFAVTTDDFSRTFWLQSDVGNVLLVIILLVVFGVLAFITTIKSNTI